MKYAIALSIATLSLLAVAACERPMQTEEMQPSAVGEALSSEGSAQEVSQGAISPDMKYVGDPAFEAMAEVDAQLGDPKDAQRLKELQPFETFAGLRRLAPRIAPSQADLTRGPGTAPLPQPVPGGGQGQGQEEEPEPIILPSGTVTIQPAIRVTPGQEEEEPKPITELISDVLKEEISLYKDGLFAYIESNRENEGLKSYLKSVATQENELSLFNDTANAILYWTYQIVFNHAPLIEAFNAGAYTGDSTSYYEIFHWCKDSVLDGCGINALMRRNENKYGSIPERFDVSTRSGTLSFYPRDMFREQVISMAMDALERIVMRLDLKDTEGVAEAVSSWQQEPDLERGKIVTFMRGLSGLTQPNGLWAYYGVEILTKRYPTRQLDLSSKQSFDMWKNLVDGALPQCTNAAVPRSAPIAPGALIKAVLKTERDRLTERMLEQEGTNAPSNITTRMQNKFLSLAWQHVIDGTDLATLLSWGLRTIRDEGMISNAPYFDRLPYADPTYAYSGIAAAKNVEKDCNRNAGGRGGVAYRPNTCGTCYIRDKDYEICGLIGTAWTRIETDAPNASAAYRENIIAWMTDGLMRVRRQLEGVLSDDYRKELRQAMKFGPKIDPEIPSTTEMRELFVKLLGKEGKSYSCLAKESQKTFWAPKDRFYRLTEGMREMAIKSTILPGFEKETAIKQFLELVLPEVNTSCVADEGKLVQYINDWRSYLDEYFDYVKGILEGSQQAE